MNFEVIDGGVDAGACGRADTVAIASRALAVAGDDWDCVDDRVLLVATTPLDGGVEEVPVGIDQFGCVAVVEVPSGCTVIGYVASHAGDQAADGAFDAAANVAVNPHVLHQQIVCAYIRVDAVGVVVIGRRTGAGGGNGRASDVMH